MFILTGHYYHEFFLVCIHFYLLINYKNKIKQNDETIDLIEIKQHMIQVPFQLWPFSISAVLKQGLHRKN